MKFDKIHLLLVALIIGLILYINFCSETDTLTKKEGQALAEQSEEIIKRVDSMFNHLQALDSIKIINNYYSTTYRNEIKTKDSILAIHPELADSLYLYWVYKLRSERSPLDSKPE